MSSTQQNSWNGNGGFTLVELLVALGVGMYIVSLAFASLTYINKSIKQTNLLASKNDAVSQALMWKFQNKVPDPIPDMSHRITTVIGSSARSTSNNLERLFVISQTANIPATTPITNLNYDTSTGIVNFDKNIDTYIGAPIFFYSPTTIRTSASDPFTSFDTGFVESIRNGKSLIMAAPIPSTPRQNWALGTYETIYLPKMVK